MSNYREDIVDILGKELKYHPGVNEGKMFGHPGFKVLGKFFAIAYEDGLALKLSPDDYSKILQLEEAAAFAPRGGKMSTWAVLTYPDAEQYLQNLPWIEKAIEYTALEAQKQEKSR